MRPRGQRDRLLQVGVPDSLEAVQAVLDDDRLSTTQKHCARLQVAQKERALASRGHQMGTEPAESGASNGFRTRDLQSHNLAL